LPQLGADQRRRLPQVLVIGIRPARPEEALQAVAFAPGHNVDVQVRNALAYPVVDRALRRLRESAAVEVGAG
jgi:hypothetical protein